MKKRIAAKSKCYYDACAMRHSRKIIDEIRGKSMNGEVVISYLTLGEAYGSCRNESEEFEELFEEIFDGIKEHITIVSNYVSESLFNNVRKECRAIDIVDAMHVATALTNKCEIFRTADRDIHGLTNSTRKKLRIMAGISNFKISKLT